jgi:phosphate starvation-inducible PhoH-like protein
MSEEITKEIIVEGVDARELYGAQDAYLEQMRELCPKVKIVARGSQIKALGAKSDVMAFERRMNALVEYYIKYGHISSEVVSQAFSSSLTELSVEPPAVDKDAIVYGNNGAIIRARTVNQQRLVKLAQKNDLLFAVGPAGSGKTYTAIALAVRALKNKEVKKLILCRPAVEAGEKLGFLPGDMKEKIDPYLQPLYDALEDMIPPQKLKEFMELGIIQIAPLAFMRGRTLNDAVVILDEAQNTTIPQLKMFLTRMGMNTKMIVTGDLTQIDLPSSVRSGLSHAMHLLRDIKGISIIEMNKKDIVRHKLVTRIVEAYEKETASPNPSRRGVTGADSSDNNK